MIMYRNRGIVSITVIVWYTSTRLSNSIDENGRSEQWRTTGVLRVRRDVEVDTAHDGSSANILPK